MRNPTFSKNQQTSEWESRPFQGVHYRIVKRWLKGYVLYLNDQHVASGATLAECKTAARENLHASILAAVNPCK